MRQSRARQDGDPIGVHIIGEPNIAATVPTDSSALYARNVLDFLKLVVDKRRQLRRCPADDDIVAACLLCTNGEIKRKN